MVEGASQQGDGTKEEAWGEALASVETFSIWKWDTERGRREVETACSSVPTLAEGSSEMTAGRLRGGNDVTAKN